MTVKRKVGSTGAIDFPTDLLSIIQVKPGQYVNLDATATAIEVTKYISPVFNDGFNTAYVLTDGKTSPDGVWKCSWTGGGRVASENGVLNERPQAATDPTGNETHSSLVLSTAKYTNFVLDFDMRTNQQLRVNYPAKNWETAWIMFRYYDKIHHYYFTLKKQGFEFGKKDNKEGDTALEKQIFLATGGSPSVTLGNFQHITITATDFHITIAVNGNKIIDMVDTPQNKPKMAVGSIGLYNEDSSVSFDNVVLQVVE